jgi:hypothetical protein
MLINENNRTLVQCAILVTSLFVLYETAEFALTATKGHASVSRWIGCELVVIAMVSLLRFRKLQVNHKMICDASSVIQLLYVLVGVIACLHLGALR